MNPPSRLRVLAFTSLQALITSAALTFTLAPGTSVAQEQTARLVKDTNREPAPSIIYIGWVAPLPTGVAFVSTSQELWISNGTPKSTRMLEASRAWGYSKPTPFGTGANAKIAIDRIHPAGQVVLDIWATDGTEAGTVPIFQPADSWETEVLAATTNGFYFDNRPWDQPQGFELYFSDGTAAGTRSLNPWDGVNPRRFSFPKVAFTDGPSCYFIANGNEIWRSDGTDLGTTKILTLPVDTNSDIRASKAGQQMFITIGTNTVEESGIWSCPLDGSTITPILPVVSEGWFEVKNAVAFGDELIFTTFNDNHDYKLWRSDGTAAGTRQLTIPAESDFTAYDGEFTRWHGSVYFLPEFAKADSSTRHEVLFRIDSASDSLTQLGKFGLGSSLPPDTPWREREPYLYFHNGKPNSTAELWQTKGDAASTKLAKLPANHYLRATLPTEVADTSLGIFFAGNGPPQRPPEALYRAKGKNGATRLTLPQKFTSSGIVEFPESPTLAPSTPLYEKVGKGLISFVAIDGEFELWQMNPDGSRARAIWKPAKPLVIASIPMIHGTVGNGDRAIFSCFSNTEGCQYWVTDGTKKGTRFLAAIQEPPHDFVTIGGTSYFSLLHTGLWKTDGTPEGTSNVSMLDMHSSNMTAFQGKVWFIAPNPNGRFCLWSSDGTAAGTVIVKDSWYGQVLEVPGGLSVVNGKLTFWVRRGSAQALWQSDGTTDGTVAVTTPSYFSFGSMDPVVDLNGVAVFPARKYQGNFSQIWCYDATTGLRPLQANPDVHDSSYLYPWAFKHVIAGDRLFYTYHTIHGPTLWVTDGTDAGTHELVTPGTTNVPYSPLEMLAVGNQVYFSARDTDHGYELWRSDGTIPGTALVADIQPGFTSSSPQGLKVINGKLYFNAKREDVGRELFSIDLPQ